MTVAKNRKRYVRDIQSRTGWSYMQCKDLVDRLGYDRVSRRIDEVDSVALHHGHDGTSLLEALQADAKTLVPFIDL